MREVLLIRHGMTGPNERRQFTGGMDVPLSPRGREALLSRRERYPAATRYFTSGMLRAVETLALIYGDVAHTDIPQLAEIRLGAFEGKDHDTLMRELPEAYGAWLSGEDAVCPGGESRRAFAARVLEGWRALIAMPWEGLAAVVIHGGVIHSLAAQLVPDTPLEQVRNGEGIRLRLAEDGGILAMEAFT